MMEEMLKLNGCNNVDELQAKVARGESIIEATDTSWNAGLQKQHYAAYDAMIAARNAEASLMNLNASLRQAELGTHGDTNALWAKQNIQGGGNNPPVNAYMKHYIDLFMTAPFALTDFKIGGAVLGFAVHTASDGLNWKAGHGDGVTFTSNAASNVVSTGASAGTAHLVGKAVAGILGTPLGFKGRTAAYVLGFGAGALVSYIGLNEPIETVLRPLDDRNLLTPQGWYGNLQEFNQQKNQMQIDYQTYQNQRFDYMKNIKNSSEYSSELNWNMQRIRNERKGNYWTGVRG